MEEKTKTAGTDFNPRSPHGERRPAEWRTPMIYKFQSTLPARGATRKRGSSAAASTFQSTLPARGATGRGKSGILYHLDFNPRSPHGERLARPNRKFRLRDFNPRSPHGERPNLHQLSNLFSGISIHAPRTGSDETEARFCASPPYFNPRSPHGERRVRRDHVLYDK